MLLPEAPRIAVVGTTGSGKTVLAKRIAVMLGMPHIELDALHWEPNWVEAPTEVFQARIRAATTGERWVCDGNYSRGQGIVLQRANVVAWLDYPLWLVLWQLGCRTIRRVVRREVLWSGNREGLRAMFGRDSLFLWALRTHRRRRRQYTALAAEPGHLTVVRLATRLETDAWLHEVGSQLGTEVSRPR